MDIDYYSIDSETIETIDFLRPPVKRVCRNSNRRQDLIAYLIGDSNRIDIARDYTVYQTGKSKTSKHIKRTVESSLSLVLQKTCKKEIFEKYSLLGNNIKKRHSDENVYDPENKPLIKVSVIPKADQKPLIDALETNKKITRSIQKPVPKDENSIQTKNLYLVVAGKREKIYEIKTTGSAKLSDDVSDEEDVKELYVHKRNNRFSDMEKKKKKPVKERKQEVDDYPSFTYMPCLCTCKQQNSGQDSHAESSRVHIVGRVGRNEDDKFVMKCAATVNGLPVATDYGEVDSTFYNKLDNELCMGNTKETQATQVDFKFNLPNSSSTCDQKVQCNACDVCVQNGCCENSRIQATNSPLVIISVYPKQEPNSFAVTHAKPDITFPSQKSFTQNYGRQTNLKENITKNAFISNKDMRKHRDLSPNKKITQNFQILGNNQNNDTVNADFGSTRRSSPARKSTQNDQPSESKNDSNKRKKTTITKTYRASRLTLPSNKLPKPVQELKSPTTKRDFDKIKPKSRSNSPNRISISDKRQRSFMDLSKENKDVTTFKRTDVRKQESPRSRSASRSREKGVNTDGIRISNMQECRYSKKASKSKKKNNKKGYVITSDKPMHNQNPKQKYSPQNNISKVSVNIDSEKEYYDVIFERGKFNTDLIVRQTMKENGSQKYFEQQFEDDFEETFYSNRKSDSLENYLPIDTEPHHRRSVSQAFNNVPTDAIPVSEHTSRLNVRDSLEISHRRDGKDANTQAHKRLFEYESTEDNDRDFFAPIKHYTGDNCTICDPVERDKEIRELLGVNSRMDYDHTAEARHNACCCRPISSHCLFQHTLCESLTAKVTLRKSCSCSSCTRMRMALAGEQIFNNSPRKCVEKNFHELEEQDLIKLKLNTLNCETAEYIHDRANEKITNKNKNKVLRMINQTTQYETLEKSTKNHNIQDFLNLEPCSKRKAILLSRKHYTKVKKTIHKLSEKRKKRKTTWNSSIVSIGLVKAKTKSEYLMHWNKEVQTDPTQDVVQYDNKAKRLKIKEIKEAGDIKNNTVVLFTRQKDQGEVNNDLQNKEVRKVTSSVEIRYTSIAYMKEPTCSITNVGSLGSSNLERKRHQSIETIFRGHKKARTPNLGTSVLSLLTEVLKSVTKSEKSLSPESKPKKPFLRRLMSCLVMRAGRSTVKLGAAPEPEPPTMNSSYDSYHISTSLGAIEMNSSLYDTSVSFYSNHTIGPVNNKMKRGFLSSVRGFLTTRKS